MRAPFALVALLLLALGASAQPLRAQEGEADAVPERGTAESRFDELERVLLDAESVWMRATVTSTGVVHNLAMLSSGAPPDGTAGGIREWVQLRNFRDGATRELDEREVDVIHFDLVVGGQPSGSASLWLDSQSGLPVLREQTVEFPRGTMQVTERYERVALDQPVSVERFAIPSHAGD